MSNVTTRTKRGLVRWALLAPQSASPLLAVFQGLLTARVRQTNSGLVLTSTAANGHATTFEVLDQDMTPGEARDLAEELITRYEEAVAALGAEADEEDSGEPEDSEIAARMLRDLGDPIRTLRTDFSGALP